MSDNSKTLSLYRMEQARDCFDTARINYEAGKYKGAANRVYYAVFNAIRAVTIRSGIDLRNTRLFFHVFVRNISRQVSLMRSFPILLRLRRSIVQTAIIWIFT